MTTPEASTLRKELVGLNREQAYEVLIRKLDDLISRVNELEYEVYK